MSYGLTDVRFTAEQMAYRAIRVQVTPVDGRSFAAILRLREDVQTADIISDGEKVATIEVDVMTDGLRP